MKNYLPSWRHSARTATNARRSKVISGRIYDACLVFCFVGVELSAALDSVFANSRKSFDRLLSANIFGVTYVASKFFGATYVATVMTPSDDSSPWSCRTNVRRSHSCRKMVGIAGQGGLIADRYRPDGEPLA